MEDDKFKAAKLPDELEEIDNLLSFLEISIEKELQDLDNGMHQGKASRFYLKVNFQMSLWHLGEDFFLDFLEMEPKRKPKPMVPSQSVKKLRSRPKVPPKPKIPPKATTTDEFEELDNFLNIIDGCMFFLKNMP